MAGKKIGRVLILLVGIYVFVGNVACADAKTVKSVVRHSKEVYYKTNNSLKSYQKSAIAGEYTDYWKKRKLMKAITFPTAETDSYVKKYTAEYYYDANQHLVFAFAYRKVKGKLQEHRVYYGTDGKMYRYIDAKGKIRDYAKGKELMSQSKKLPHVLYFKGSYYWNLAQECYDDQDKY